MRSRGYIPHLDRSRQFGALLLIEYGLMEFSLFVSYLNDAFLECEFFALILNQVKKIVSLRAMAPDSFSFWPPNYSIFSVDLELLKFF